MVAVPTGAAAYLTEVHTGWFGDPERSTEDVDSSKYLDVCAPGYADIVREHRPDGALPQGAYWQRAEAVLIDRARSSPDCAPEGAGLMEQATGIDASYAFYARCMWAEDTFAAADAGQGERRIRAGRELKTLANSELNHAIDGGGIVEMDNRIAEQVIAGDLKLAREFNTGCGSNW